MVSVDGVIRDITSMISSVCMRSPSNAPGFDSFECSLAPMYLGWHLPRSQQAGPDSEKINLLSRILPLQAHVVEIVLTTQLGCRNHWIQAVYHILPHSLPT